jgi:molecular chaperone DnaK (HSP70)
MQDGMFAQVAEPAAQTAEWAIGVDFGTAFSKAAATRVTYGQGSVLREITPLRIGAAANWARPFLVPSTMFLDRARVHFGPRAAERLQESDQEHREMLRSFKTILGANDFEHALDFFTSPAIDPDSVFRLRDLIVLYLAYLLALVDAAAMERVGGDCSSAKVRLRFSRPGWIPDRIALAHEAMMALFIEANGVRGLLGDALLAHEGVPYQAALGALAQARAAPRAFPSLDGGVYEASAVGLCHYSDAKAPNYLVIVDIGAGTTDVAGLLRTPFQGNIRVIRAARRTIDIAGDSIDAALLNLILSKARKLKSVADRTALWRSVVPRIRDLKEELFDKGKISVAFRDAAITCKVADLCREREFKAVLADITKLYEKSLAEVVYVGRREGARKIGVVLAGGGSHLPAIHKMIAKKRWLGPGVRIERLPMTPAWAHEAGSARDFESLFAQLSVAFGAAISGPEQTQSRPI